MTPIPDIVKALKEHFPIKIEGYKVVGVALHIHNYEEEKLSIYVHARSEDPSAVVAKQFCGHGKTPENAVAELQKNIISRK